jgi:hypothetical protein
MARFKSIVYETLSDHNRLLLLLFMYMEIKVYNKKNEDVLLPPTIYISLQVRSRTPVVTFYHFAIIAKAWVHRSINQID